MTDETRTVPYADGRDFCKGLPWVILILPVAFASWAFWRALLPLWVPADEVGLASIGISTMGAYAICLIALAGNWPLASIENKWARGVAMIIVSQIVAALLFIILSACFSVSLTTWAFPIIATSWFVLSVTSFVGGDFHLQHLPPVRRMLLNLLISVGFTVLLMRTIVIFPALWFPFLQVTIITGGLSYLFRKVSQPTYSVLVWALLMTLMFVFLTVASWTGYYALFDAPKGWGWNIGTATPEFNVFFAFCCGMNLGVLACIKCWPFSLIRQPFGTCVATLSMLAWCLGLTCLALPLFKAIFPDGDYMGEASVMAWHTVFWGFAWVYCFGVGQTPYLWNGQKTAGTWDDVD